MGSLNINSVSTPPKPAKGIDDKMVRGWIKLSYKIPKTIYITIAAANKRNNVSLIVDEIALAAPTNSSFTLSDSTSLAIFSARCKPSFGVKPSASEKRMTIDGSWSRLDKLGDPRTSFHLAKDLKGIKSPSRFVK